MSTVINKTTLDFLTDVDLSVYSEEQWIINPDMSAIVGIDPKYWKISGSAVIEMTTEEKAAVDTQELEDYRALYISWLWDNAYSYNFQYFSGGIYAAMLQGILAGSTKCKENQDWINSLWTDYYTRKYYVNAYPTKALIDTVSLDYGNNGIPPHLVPEVMAELSHLNNYSSSSSSQSSSSNSESSSTSV